MTGWYGDTSPSNSSPTGAGLVDPYAGARLVLVQPSFPLDNLKPGFKLPSGARNLYRLGELGVLRGEDDVIGEFLKIV